MLHHSERSTSEPHHMASLLLLLVAVGANTEPNSRLAVISRAPEFSLINQDNQKVHSADLRGKVLLVGFIFTTCNGTCPATTHRMALIQQELKNRGHFKAGRVHLLSITLDPARDTPEVLRQYMKLYDAEPAHWTFLTGAPDKVAKTIADWGMWVR